MVETIHSRTYHTDDGRVFDIFAEAYEHEKRIKLAEIFTREYGSVAVSATEIVNTILKYDSEIAHILGIAIEL